MCRQEDDPVGLLLKKVFSCTAQISYVLFADWFDELRFAAASHKDSERARDADSGRKEAGFGPIVLASNHLRGRLGSAHQGPPEINIKEVILY